MTRMPIVRQKIEALFKQKPNAEVNPDEVVAVGAAIQGAVLAGNVKDVLLLDVTPLTLGIEVAGGLTEPIIGRNTTVPCKKSKVFTTALDSQDMVRVHVVQGERPMCSENKSLGRLELSGIPPAPRGLPEIEVTFELDSNGIMNVRAKDLGTGKAQSMRIVSHSGLGEEEIQEMLREAEAFRDEDERRKELGEARNHLDGLIYTSRRSLDEYGSNLDEKDFNAIRDAILAAEDSLDSNDLEFIVDCKEHLALAAHRLAESIYAAAADDVDEYIEDEDWDDDFSDSDDAAE